MPSFGLLGPSLSSELPAIADLVNSAYRGESSRAGWTTEADFLGGQRTDAEALAADLSANPEAHVLAFREEAGGPILGCLWLEPAEQNVWYVGMVTVDPRLQDRQIGRRMLALAEAFAAERGANRMRMTVIHIRDTLIAWYERRGYRRTGETRPFPYGDSKFGAALRDDLKFVILEKDLQG